MKIDIDRFGLENVQVDPDTLFTFPNGMAGFENFKRFKLFHEEGGGTVFWLQAVDNAKVSFPVVAPDALDIAYEIKLSDEDCALIELDDAADAVVVVVVYRDAAEGEAEGGAIAANTRSPVILNLKTRLGMQKVLQEVRPSLTYRAR
jgi:flagellar assembly factor FliW